MNSLTSRMATRVTYPAERGRRSPRLRALGMLARAACTAFALLASSTVARAQQSRTTSTAQPKGTTLDFANARLADVIRTLASMLGRTVVVSDIPDARVTFSTAAALKPSDLEAILESVLESHNLMLVNKGNVSQVMPRSYA